MRRSPSERRDNIDGIESTGRHPQHAGEEGDDGADTRYEAREKHTLGAVTLKEGLAFLNQFRVTAQRPETKNFAVVSMPEPERKTITRDGTCRGGDQQRPEQ